MSTERGIEIETPKGTFRVWTCRGGEHPTKKLGTDPFHRRGRQYSPSEGMSLKFTFSGGRYDWLYNTRY
jgi:hypothetical protein